MSWHRWIAASLVLHGAAAGIAMKRAAPRRRAAEPPLARQVEFDQVTPGAPGALTRDGARALARLGGARRAQNVDSDDPGARGDGRSASEGLHLAARAEGVDLDPRTLNNLRARQEQRIRTSRDRRSPQDDRRTPNPDDDPWVTTGSGVLLTRVPAAPTRPADGARRAAAPSPPRAASAGVTTDLPVAQRDPRVGGGLRGATGASHRAAGPLATQRPSLRRGHASTTSDEAAARPSDDEDSALLAASLQRAFVASSVHAGPTRGDGVGGVGGGGAPGSGGGAGRGGRAAPLGSGDGWISLSSDDARTMRYLLDVRRRLAPLWANAFPREDALRLRQGTVIVAFTIARDGGVSSVAVRRRSGVDGFDANVLRALRGARFAPIPAELGMDHLNIRAPLEFSNPAVR